MGLTGKFLTRLSGVVTCAALLTGLHTPLSAAPTVDNNAKTTAPRPNIIVFLSDDMGYSDIGAMGGEINTPNLDKLAAGGKIFTQFYNTPRCCPSRATLLTGLYSHQVGIGHLVHKTPHIGYGDYLTSDSITIAEVLKQAGYGTYMVGKWHLAPRNYDPKTDIQYWPLRRGFDKFYGTINGSNSFWDPSTLARGEKYITAFDDPKYKPENYYYTDAITDNAVMFLKEHEQENKDEPFFMYVAYTAAHWPLHAPEDEIAAYDGKYDTGYKAIHDARIKRLRDKGFIPRVGGTAPVVGDWDDVDNKDLEAALMETYAAMVTSMDKGIGKIIDQLRAEGKLDNTLILYMQDNGACAEDPFGKPRPERDPAPMKPDEPQRSQPQFTRDGTPVRTGHDVYPGPAETLTAYRENWANVSNAPFRYYKHFVHEGGISTPLVANWPDGIKVTSSTHVVRQATHMIDIMPTLLELAGTQYPTDRKGVPLQPEQGVSLVPVLTDGGDITRSEPLFWEHEGNRAVRDGKWKIVAISEEGAWALYDMEKDRGETHDLSKEHPDIVNKMSAQWDAWAERSRVLPLGGWRDRIDVKRPPKKAKEKITAEQGRELPAFDSLHLQGNGIKISTEVLSGPVEGVIVAQGASFNGFSIYAKDGKIHFVATIGKELHEISTSIPAETPFRIEAEILPDGSASLRAGHNHTTAPFGGVFPKNPAQGLSVGIDSETPVGDYPKGFKFKGKIGTVQGQILKKK